MALATQADVEAVLNRDLTSDEENGVASQLDRASDLVVGYLRQEPPTPPPGPVTRAVAEMVAAVFRRGDSGTLDASQQSAGPYGTTFVDGSTSGGPWLTNTLKIRLRPYRLAMVSMELSSEGYA